MYLLYDLLCYTEHCDANIKHKTDISLPHNTPLLDIKRQSGE